LSLINGVLSIDPPSSYSQKYEDNPDAEGKERIFQPISEDLINMPLWQKIIFSDLEIAKAIGEVKFDKKVEIGFHQVRYAPTPNEMSYSSPPWLHRDTEPTVFIHLINLTSNALGGENIIAFDPKPTSYHRMIKLVDPLDTLLVNRKHFHSVVPLAVERGQVAYRDILLVTFKNI
jgi:hypothetical protein